MPRESQGMTAQPSGLCRRQPVLVIYSPGRAPTRPPTPAPKKANGKDSCPHPR